MSFVREEDILILDIDLLAAAAKGDLKGLQEVIKDSSYILDAKHEKLNDTVGNVALQLAEQKGHAECAAYIREAIEARKKESGAVGPATEREKSRQEKQSGQAL
jgi:hypothetical protein